MLEYENQSPNVTKKIHFRNLTKNSDKMRTFPFYFYFSHFHKILHQKKH
jgi:hypothetical protein